MKRFLMLYIISVVLLSCDTDDSVVGYDEIVVSEYVKEYYSRDAKQLYFHEIIQDNLHFNYDNPVLDEGNIDQILKIIQAVYDLDIPERDTVFDVYKIHGYYCYSFNGVTLKVNTDVPSIENLSSNVFTTGDISLDNLLNKYAFDSVRTAYSYPDFPWLTIYSKSEWNLIPIVKEFKPIDGVLLTDFNRGCIGGGNMIDLERNNNYAIIRFSIGWGDCPAGCIHRRFWEFSVLDGKAKFIRSFN